MLSVFVRYTAETGREHVGNWAIKMELPAATLNDLSSADLHEIHELIRLHGLEGVSIRDASRRRIWPPLAEVPEPRAATAAPEAPEELR